MSKVVIQNKNGKITIINRLTYPEAVNERLYNSIISGMFKSFLPIAVDQKRKETLIECSVYGLQTIDQYFSGLVSKKMFLDLVYQIALIIKDCEKNMVNANNLELQKDRVFIDPITKRVKCIYWPIVNNQNSSPPHLFLKQLPYEVNFSPYEGDFYLKQYTAFFDGHSPFSINSFEKMIMEMKGKKSDDGIYNQSDSLFESLPEYLEHSKKEKVVVEKTSSNVEYDPFLSSNLSKKNNNEFKLQPFNSHIFCSMCGAKNQIDDIFCCACNSKLSKPAIVSHKLDDKKKQLIDSEGTTVLGFDGTEDEVFPTLTRNKTGEKITINKPIFKIGSKQEICDFSICNNSFISRNHVDIITRNERYFVVDKNSTNKTYVDGKVISSEKEVEIFNGTILKLANEEFLFSLD